VVTPEGKAELALVLGHDPRQRHGQVVAQGQLFLALGMLGVEDLLLGVLAQVAVQRLAQFQRWRLQRLKAERLEDGDNGIDDVLSPDQLIRQEVAHPLRGAGLHHLGHRASLLGKSRFAGNQKAQTRVCACESRGNDRVRAIACERDGELPVERSSCVCSCYGG